MELPSGCAPSAAMTYIAGASISAKCRPVKSRRNSVPSTFAVMGLKSQPGSVLVAPKDWDAETAGQREMGNLVVGSKST